MTDSSEKTLDFFLDRLTQNAARYPTKTAVTFLASGPNGGKVESQLTYSQLQEQTSALACRLLQNGLTQGDTAVLVYPPSLDYMVAFLACLKAGIVAVPVFPPNPARPSTLSMFSSICQSSGAKFALTSVSYNHAKKLAGIKESLTKWKRPTTAAWPEDLTWLVTNDTTNNNNKAFITLNYSPSRQNVAFLQYTSGSTSEPKGVMITHANLAHNLTLILDELSAKDDTVVVSWLPQYHDMGLIGSYLGVLYCGGSGYYLSPLTFLQRPQIWIEAISKYKATHLQAPNFAFALTSRKYSRDDTLDLSSVRHVINAAEPVDEESMDSFVKTFEKHGFPQNVIYPTYGLAEHTVFVCSGGTQRLRVDKQALEVDSVVQICNDDGTKEMTKCVGCGYPKRQGLDVKIVNTTTCQALPEDNVGEIWIQSPSKAAGYFGKPELTKHDFHAQLRSGSTSNANDVLDDINGYLRTGDLGFMHNDELFICGRLKDLIIVGGRNYYPQDLEATAEASSELLRPGCSAAFTIDPTHEGGEQVALVAELRDVPSGKNVDAVCVPLVETIRSSINQEHSLGLSHIVLLRPRTVPKTSSGKIARAWCRKAFLGETLEVVYRKSFKSSTNNETNDEQVSTSQAPALSQDQVEALRAMDSKEILSKLVTDVSKIGSVPKEAVDPKAALVTILDSLSISQFKGLLEAEYAVKISDEYLFREKTNLNKLVEVVKLGYAPDDGDENAPVAAAPPSSVGTRGGLAGALGCPPGVCCVVM